MVNIVKLNLFNYVLALFRAKFACNSALRNPVFMWKYCKGYLWESVKNWSSVYNKEQLTTDSQVVTRQNVAHMWSMQEVEGSRQDKKYSLAFLLTRD